MLYRRDCELFYYGESHVDTCSTVIIPKTLSEGHPGTDTDKHLLESNQVLKYSRVYFPRNPASYNPCYNRICIVCS